MQPLLLIAGFGAFEAVERNASGLVAEALGAAPPAGVDISAAVLPVSFRRAGPAWDALLARNMDRRPAALLGLGVQKKATFRLEERARGTLGRRGRPDVDGVDAAELVLREPELLCTSFDLERLTTALVDAGARPDEVVISTSAGGYVCECSYYHLLTRAAELGVPGLFLHLPPGDAVDVERQTRVVAGLLPALVEPV